MRDKNKLGLIAIILVAFSFSLAFTQEWPAVLEEIYSLGSPSGYEQPLISKIRSLLPLKSETDNLGSLIIRSESQPVKLLIAVPVDEWGYFVSGLTSDGFLRLDRALAPPFRIFDNQLMGHGVIIWTRKGPVQGIIAQPAIHILSRERRETLERGLTLDDIYVDVGAKSEAEVREKGIEILDAVTKERRLTALGSRRLGGLCLGDKLFPAVLISALHGLKDFNSIERGGLALAWVAQTRVSARGAKGSQSLGILNIKNRLKIRDAIIFYGWPAEEDEIKPGPRLGRGPVLALSEEKPSALASSIIALASSAKISIQVLAKQESPLLRPFQDEGGDAFILGVAVRDMATSAETISRDDADSLLKLLTLFLEGRRDK